ncbi:hypothetical protein MTR_4g127610 [Medicago truncatula]|uniref:Uncharacterized protein n=1 Tax=Medicago truncatula TaxID=3880 RepID=G7JUC2_MEDTR|nr:hypothetical protein MTR_4g127610 [Medicago truncatula]
MSSTKYFIFGVNGEEVDNYLNDLWRDLRKPLRMTSTVKIGFGCTHVCGRPRAFAFARLVSQNIRSGRLRAFAFARLES